MNYDTTQSRGNGAVGAVFLAAALGAVVGMLFAPKKGTETREDLMNKYNDVKHQAHDRAADAKQRMVRGMDAARNKVHSAADKTKDMTDDMTDKAKKQLSDDSTDETLASHIAAEDKRRRKSM